MCADWKTGFYPADILLPKDCDLTKWSVVACDQYTSEPAYWQRVEEFVGRAPSSLRLILPESCLEGPDVEGDIQEINTTMAHYLREGCFQEYPGSMIYVERTLHSGALRRGLIGMVDLEQYDYEPGAGTLVRATEGTVLSRIPPRVAVRKNAPLELPHVMLLTDDPGQTVIEPLSDEKEHMEMLYDFELMESGGHICGYRLTPAGIEGVEQALTALMDPGRFQARYHTDGAALLFAVGDGNHSLATAKECYERQKKLTTPEHWPTLPSRYALAELVNLHDASLEFEPIHRVVFGVDPGELLAALLERYPNAYYGEGTGHVLTYVCGRSEGKITIPDPEAQLAVGTLQIFLDEYQLKKKNCRLDYIHGEAVVRKLTQRPDTIGFLLSPMEKGELFQTVIHDGVLPRKTFSMGEANDKRFYLEARKIR